MTEGTKQSDDPANRVRKVMSVQAPPTVAWRVFTEKMGTWWPLDSYKDALAVCFAFNTMNRLANAFEFFVPDPAGLEAGAKFLLARGYR